MPDAACMEIALQTHTKVIALPEHYVISCDQFLTVNLWKINKALYVVKI